MYAAKNPSSGFSPFVDLPPNPQVLYGWGKKEDSCPKCGLKDFGNSTVDMHIKRDHPKTPQGTYSCWICPYTFRKQGQFVKHHREGHAGEKMACWVCGEKNWSSTALVYGHIKRNHPGYRKGIAREYFATLKSKAGKVHVAPSVSSKVTSSSNFDSLSDSTSMDSYYSEYSTDLDDDGAPIFGMSYDDYEDTRIDLEEDCLVDEDGAPIVESLSSPLTKSDKHSLTCDQIVIQQEKSITVTNQEIVTVSPHSYMNSSMVVNDIPFGDVDNSSLEKIVAINVSDPSSEVLENADLILGI